MDQRIDTPQIPNCTSSYFPAPPPHPSFYGSEGSPKSKENSCSLYHIGISGWTGKKLTKLKPTVERRQTLSPPVAELHTVHLSPSRSTSTPNLQLFVETGENNALYNQYSQQNELFHAPNRLSLSPITSPNDDSSVATVLYTKGVSISRNIRDVKPVLKQVRQHGKRSQMLLRRAGPYTVGSPTTTTTATASDDVTTNASDLGFIITSLTRKAIH